MKQYVIPLEDVADLEAFANETGRREALGVVAALGFASGVRERLSSLGVLSLDMDDLLRTVAL